MTSADCGPLAGRVAIVTGASRGIGRDVALRLAAAGAAVAVAARTASSGEGGIAGSIDEVADEICSAGGTALAQPCDVADDDACRRLVEAARSALGPVDILVNNAAATVPDRRGTGRAEGVRPSAREMLSIANFPLAMYRRAFEVNLFGPYLLTQLVVADMTTLRRGNVVNISSDAAHVPGTGPYRNPRGVALHAYGNSKAALEHLTRTSGYELAQYGIAVNAVLPSRPIETPGAVFASGGRLGETLGMDRFVDAVERLCSVTPDEMTGAVVYSEDLLDPAERSRGWLGAPYL